jgi:hypothetical protein
MPNYLIIPARRGIKPEKAKNWQEALERATAMSIRHTGVEVQLYELHTKFRYTPPETQPQTDAR